MEGSRTASEEGEPLFFKGDESDWDPKFHFSVPITCPIDLFGPVANETILKRLHA